MNSIYKQMDLIDDEESLTETVTKQDAEMFDFNLFDETVDHDYTDPINIHNAVSAYFGDRRHRVSNPSGSGSGDCENDQHHIETRGASDKTTPVSHKNHPKIHQRAVQEVTERILNSKAFKSSGWTTQELANYLQWRTYKDSVEEYIKRRSDAYERVIRKGSKQIDSVLDELKKDYPNIVSNCTTSFLKDKESEPEQLKVDTEG